MTFPNYRISRRIAVAFTLVTFGAALHAADNFDLVKNGKADATIVLSATPTLSAKYAAKELVEHISKMTGAILPIATDAENVTGKKIAIGDSQITKEMGLAPDKMKPLEFLIDVQKDTLVLYGRDKADATGEHPGFFEDKGSLDATYEFLERDLGVRWYHPGEMGRIIPEQTTASVPLGKLQQVPTMSYFWPVDLNFIRIPRAEDTMPEEEEVLWRLRMRMGGQKYEANHSFYGYYDRFLKDHREYFGKETVERPAQLCYTEPGLIQQVTQDANDFFDGKGSHAGAMGMGDFFGLVPMDNVSWCPCDRCQAELAINPDKSLTGFANGKASHYFWGFANKIAKELKKTHPDKFIATLAYMDWAGYPEGMELENNISVQMCLGVRNWWETDPAKNGEMRIYDSWVKHANGRPLYLWLYFNFPAMSSAATGVFPGFASHRIIEYMKQWNKDNIRGIFLEHSSEFGQSHLLDVPDIYLMSRLARDSSLDGNKILNEFFPTYYGEAAGKPMQELYNHIEKIYWDPKIRPADVTVDEEMSWGHLGSTENMAEMRPYMEEARKLAVSRNDKTRVNYFDVGVWDPMEEALKLHPHRSELRKIEIPKMTIPKVANADGDPAKVDWSKAYTTRVFKQLSGEKATFEVTAKLAHDDKYLYIQHNDSMKGSQLRNANDWQGDDFEIFIAQSRQGPYAQLALLPDGTKAAERIAGAGTGLWNSNAIIKPHFAADQTYQTEVALPLEALGPIGIKPGETFFMQLYRQKQFQSELLAWSPHFGGGFHNLSRSAEVTLE